MKMFGYEIKLEKIKPAGLPKCNVNVPMSVPNEEVLVLGYNKLGHVFDLSKIDRKIGDPIIAVIETENLRTNDKRSSTFEVKGFVEGISEYHINIKGENSGWIICPSHKIVSIK